jgi:hypothetical protein
MDDFVIPTLPKWGSPAWLEWKFAVARGAAAMQESRRQRIADCEQLERIYRLPESK